MQDTRYGLKVSVNLPFEQAAGKATAAPKTVIVYQTGPATSIVAALAPLAALGVAGDNPALADIAREADAPLRAALDEVEKA